MALPPPITAYSQEEILRLFDRLLPPHYIDALKSPGPGYEVLQAAAKAGARLSEAIANYAMMAFIQSASGGVKATGTVEFYRPAVHPEGISIVVKQGTLLQSSKSGRQYATVADVTFAPTDLGPFEVEVEAVVTGFNFNEPGMVLTADGTVLQGEIDTIVTLIEDPDVSDTTILVRHPTSTSGGIDPALDAHGKDRLIIRGSTESDSSYRGRIRALPDNISPNAIERALQQLLFPYGANYALTETFEIVYQTCWDAPSDFIAGSGFDPTTFVFDDPRSNEPFRNRWYDLSDMRGAFVVVVDNLAPISDRGMVWDEAGDIATDFTNPKGIRGLSCFDQPSDVEASFGYLFGCWDGPDTPKETLYTNIYNTLQSIKAAGVSAALELRGE